MDFDTKSGFEIGDYEVVENKELDRYNRGQMKEINRTITVSEFKDKLRFYEEVYVSDDYDGYGPWDAFPNSYDCKYSNGWLEYKEISKEPNRKQPPQFGDVGCFSANRSPDMDMFVVVDYDEPNDIIYAVFPYLTLKDGKIVINFGSMPAMGCGKHHDKASFVECKDSDKFKIYKFPYQRDSHGLFHSYLSIDAISTFYDEVDYGDIEPTY
jgi:hypothetical protein